MSADTRASLQQQDKPPNPLGLDGLAASPGAGHPLGMSVLMMTCIRALSDVLHLQNDNSPFQLQRFYCPLSFELTQINHQYRPQAKTENVAKVKEEGWKKMRRRWSRRRRRSYSIPLSVVTHEQVLFWKQFSLCLESPNVDSNLDNLIYTLKTAWITRIICSLPNLYFFFSTVSLVRIVV